MAPVVLLGKRCKNTALHSASRVNWSELNLEQTEDTGQSSVLQTFNSDFKQTATIWNNSATKATETKITSKSGLFDAVNFGRGTCQRHDINKISNETLLCTVCPKKRTVQLWIYLQISLGTFLGTRLALLRTRLAVLLQIWFGLIN